MKCFPVSHQAVGGLVCAVLLLAIMPSSEAAEASLLPLFSQSRSSSRSTGVDKAGVTRMTVQLAALEQLRAAPKGEKLAVSLMLGRKGMVSADVVRTELFAAGVSLELMTEEGPQDLDLPRLSFFRGSLAGDPKSLVEFTVGDAFISGTVRARGATYRFGPESDPFSGKGLHHVSYNVDDTDTTAWGGRAVCGLDALDVSKLTVTDMAVNDTGLTPALEGPSKSAAQGPVTRVARLALDADYELYTKFGKNPNAVAAYCASIINSVSAIYERDLQVRFEIVFIGVWPFNNPAFGYPYGYSSPKDLLYSMRTFWKRNNGAVSRDVAMLLSGKPVQGGVAWLGVLCNPDLGYAVSQVFGSTDQVTAEGLWDATVVAHELGHNFGTTHSHCYNPPIDTCYSGEEKCFDGAANCQKGTIMSYCHGCGGRFNIELRFHERVKATVQNYLASVDCLEVEGGDDATYTGWCRDKFGDAATDSMMDVDADPDGDGVSNMEEFVAGTDPLSPDQGAGQQVLFDPDTGTLTYTYRRNVKAEDYIVTLLFAEALDGNWEPMPDPWYTAYSEAVPDEEDINQVFIEFEQAQLETIRQGFMTLQFTQKRYRGMDETEFQPPWSVVLRFPR